MDRVTYDQLDRIESGIQLLIGLDASVILEEFYAKEIVSPNGKLHHLNNDNILRNFFEVTIKGGS